MNITTLDHFARLHGPLLYAKIDVEGGEWNVLRGMEGLLRAQEVQLLSFEYASGWHPLFSEQRPLTDVERLGVHSTLHRFQQKLAGT